MGRRPLPPDRRRPKLSGAQRRKLKHERDEAACASSTAKQGRKKEQDEAQTDGDNAAAAFAKLGAPPLDDPDTAMRWTRQVQLVALHAAVADPGIPLQTKLRLAKDLSFVVGASHNRGAMETRLVALEESLGNITPKSAVVMAPTAGRTRPPTARGGNRSRGPRAVETSPRDPLGEIPDPKERH